jgi:hypothetical protein
MFRLVTKQDRITARAIMIPAGAVKDPRSDDSAEVYTYMDGANADIPTAIGYRGTAARMAFHFRFRSVETRETHIAQFFADARAHAAEMIARKTKAAAYTHTLKVGDIARTSWGWEQTNVEFVEVVRVPSGKSVVVRQIECRESLSEGVAPMSGYVTPTPGVFCGHEKTCRVREGNIIVKPVNAHSDGYPCAADTRCYVSWYY